MRLTWDKFDREFSTKSGGTNMLLTWEKFDREFSTKSSGTNMLLSVVTLCLGWPSAGRE